MKLVRSIHDRQSEGDSIALVTCDFLCVAAVDVLPLLVRTFGHVPIHGTLKTIAGRVAAGHHQTLGCVVVDAGCPALPIRSRLWAHLAGSGFPVWVWVRNTKLSVRVAIALAERHRFPVLLEGHVFLRQGLSELIEEHPRLQRNASLVRYLGPHLKLMRHNLAAQLLASVAAISVPTAAKDLAARAGISRRTMDRCLATAGCCSASRLLAARRVLDSAEELYSHSSTLTSVARKHGFGSSGALRRQYKAALGIDPAGEAVPAPSSQHLIALLASTLGLQARVAAKE